MKLEEFWSLIEETRSNDPYEHAEEIQSQLSDHEAKDILDFERHLSGLLELSYSNRLWGAAYLINGGCSDDGFDYFRGWLILQGQAVFERACSDPDSLADLSELEDEVECEDILHAARSAYESVAGEEIPDISINLPDLGEDWDFDDDEEMQKRYPRLFAKFCSE